MFSGVLKKMVSEYGNEVIYYLNFENEFMVMNQFLDKKIKIIFNGYECLNCKSDEIIFRQGYCKKCFYDLPITGDWIMKPELSQAHLNIEDRNLEYEKKVQIQPHIVYLAFSSHLKVGVTRKSQLTTRWVDQGAHQAISLAEAPNRFLAGICEVELKSYYSDKTNWRKMLENNFETIDLKKEKDMAVQKIPKKIYSKLIPKTDAALKINFPVLKIPEKVKRLNNYKEESQAVTSKELPSTVITDL